MPERRRQPRLPAVSRRTFLRSAVVGGSGLLAAYLVGCNSDESPEAVATATDVSAAGTSTPAPTAYEWRQLISDDEGPTPRRDHSLVNDGQHLYVFGGRGPGPLADVWIYDIATNRWGPIPASGPPPPRFGHNAVWDPLTLRMIVFGGEAADGSFFNDVWALAPNLLEWEQLAAGDDAPEARYGAGGTRNRAGDLMITHGFTSAGRFDDTWTYDPATAAWVDASPPTGRPIERCLMRASWDSGRNRLLMFGGQTTGTAFLDDFWALEGGVWSQLPSGPSARNHYAMDFDISEDDLFLFGGNTEEGPANDAWRYDAGDRWTQLEIAGETPSPRLSHDASWVPATSSLFTFGGNDGDGNLDDLWQLRVARA